jgi:hypothetical protein
MRAHAPFPVLLATAALLLASVLLPVALLAKSPKKNHIPKQPKEARHAKAVHPRSNVHKVGKHEKRVSLPKSSHRRAHVEKASSVDPATEDRVHAWVKNQNAPATTAPAPQPTSATGVSAPPPDSPQSDEAKQISVISTIRTADTTGAGKPQLPPIEEIASEPVILPTLYNKRGRLIVPPALKGSHEILIRQNQMADSDGLDRIRDDDDLDRMRRAGTLVPLPTNSTLHVDERLPANRRYTRPWTALFLDTLARQHYAHFQTALQVNSAVRTVEFQQRLIHTNGNAAPAEGDTASPHLTGQAIDIAKRGLSMAEIAWLRGYLLPLVQQGKVDVEEEFQQSCFHISVYKKYMPQAPPRRIIATTHREGMTSLGLGMR